MTTKRNPAPANNTLFAPQPITIRAIDTPTAAITDGYAQEYLDSIQSLRIELRMCTPEWANEMMDKNTDNRPLGPSNWRKLRDVIVRGAWGVNGDTIVFGRTGRVLNGQHRLTAIASGNQPVPSLVVYGVRDDLFYTFDQAKKRTAADVLYIAGKKTHSSILAATLKIQASFERDAMTNMGRVIGPDEMIVLADKHPDMIDSVEFAAANGKRNRRFPPGACAWLHYQMSQRDEAEAGRLLNAVIKSVGVVEGSHEFLLIRRLDNMAAVRTVAQVTEIIALGIKTWNRIRQGAAPPGPRALLTWKPDEPFPTISD